MGQHWKIKEAWRSIADLIPVESLRLGMQEQVCKTSFRGLVMKELRKECLKHSNTRSWIEHNLLNKFI